MSANNGYLAKPCAFLLALSWSLVRRLRLLGVRALGVISPSARKNRVLATPAANSGAVCPEQETVLSIREPHRNCTERLSAASTIRRRAFRESQDELRPSGFRVGKGQRVASKKRDWVSASISAKRYVDGTELPASLGHHDASARARCQATEVPLVPRKAPIYDRKAA